jgi:hypothetical protein
MELCNKLLFLKKLFNYLTLYVPVYLSSVNMLVKLSLFPTVPDSSINSWDSWFIFNLQKITTCYYTNNSTARIYTGKDFKELLVI